MLVVGFGEGWGGRVGIRTDGSRFHGGLAIWSAPQGYHSWPVSSSPSLKK